MTDLGRNIRRFREERGLTQEELAEKVGVGRPIISHYEIGRKDPTTTMLGILADKLEVTTDQLLGRA